MPERRVWMVTDDPDEALRELHERRARGEVCDMAKVRDLPEPPKTAKQFVVFQTVPDESERTP